LSIYAVFRQCQLLASSKILRGAAALAEHRARFALEDALDTADFGDCGRLIVVRTLSIGRMPAGAAGWTIARAVEQAWSFPTWQHDVGRVPVVALARCAAEKNFIGGLDKHAH
jgi:hypothetical protein